MEYEVVFSKRKTVSLTVKKGRIVLKAPFGTPRKFLDGMIEKHRDWIEKQQLIQAEKKKAEEAITPEKEKELRREAKVYFLEKNPAFAQIMGLKYSGIKITGAKHRFGSCSSKGGLCFSYMLMLYPEAAREYVIVHELAHLVYMNHSRDFYAVIERFMPDWKARRALLKKIEISNQKAP